VKYVFTLFLVVQSAVSGWEYRIRTDPITDVVTKAIYTGANSIVGVNSHNEKPVLFIRVYEDGEDTAMEIGIGWPSGLPMEEPIQCITRVDQETPITYELHPEPLNRDTYFQPNGILDELFEKMLIGNEFVIRFTPENSYPITAIFSLQGMTDAANSACLGNEGE